MFTSGVKRRISALPLCHTCFVIVLFVTGGVCLAIDIAALSAKIRNCPVLNTNFVPFWFHSGVSILHLTLAILISITLIGLTCQQATTIQPKQSRYIQEYLVGAVGSTGHFITFNSPSHISLDRFVEKRVESSVQRTDAKRSHSCCHANCCTNVNCCNRCGWLQPISFLLALIFVGQIASLIWFCQLRSEIGEPDYYYFSQLTNLFVEAKIEQGNNVTPSPVDDVDDTQNKPKQFLYPDSDYCWSLIQTHFACCGPESYLDWSSNLTQDWTSTQLIGQLPSSCFCPRNRADDDLCYNRPVMETSRGFLYTSGCLIPLSKAIYKLYTMEIIAIPCSVALLMITFFCDILYTLYIAKMVISEQQNMLFHVRKNDFKSNRFWTDKIDYS